MMSKQIPSGEPITIKSNFNFTGTEILVGDQKISDVISVVFRHRVGELPTLELEMLAKDVAVDGEAAVTAVALCPACKKEMEERSQIARRNIEAIDAFRAKAVEAFRVSALAVE